jgi:hypothetical protein
MKRATWGLGLVAVALLSLAAAPRTTHGLRALPTRPGGLVPRPPFGDGPTHNNQGWAVP